MSCVCVWDKQEQRKVRQTLQEAIAAAEREAAVAQEAAQAAPEAKEATDGSDSGADASASSRSAATAPADAEKALEAKRQSELQQKRVHLQHEADLELERLANVRDKAIALLVAPLHQ